MLGAGGGEGSRDSLKKARKRWKLRLRGGQRAFRAGGRDACDDDGE